MELDREYRIGNLVRNKKGDVCTISQMSLIDGEMNISIHCTPTGEMSEKISPIKLTRKILEANGFERSYNTSLPRQISYVRDVIIFNEEFQICTNYDGGVTRIGKVIEYVHQLQNLYLVLRGEELEIKV